MYQYYNPNPERKVIDDCTVRAICRLFDKTWEESLLLLTSAALAEHNMPTTPEVWDHFFRSRGFRKRVIPNTCPYCYTIQQFAEDHQNGSYALASGNHVVAVINGIYYDSWDSGDQVPVYYWQKEV